VNHSRLRVRHMYMYYYVNKNKNININELSSPRVPSTRTNAIVIQMQGTPRVDAKRTY
jgi:hypothetical protein